MDKPQKLLLTTSLFICLVCVLFPPYIVFAQGNLFPGVGICYAPLWSGPILMEGDTADLLYPLIFLEWVGVFILTLMTLRALQFFTYIFNNGGTQDIEQPI